MTKAITITSGKGGVGKTTTAINLALALGRLGKDVIVVDANLTTPNLNIHLGAPRLPKTLHDVLRGTAPITEAVYRNKAGLRVVPASLAVAELDDLDLGRLPAALAQLEGLCDILLIDSGAGLGKEGMASLRCADEVIIVTNPELPAVSGALKTIRVARDLGKTLAGVVLTKVVGDDLELGPREIETILELPIIAAVPFDNNVRASIRLKYPVLYTHPSSPASQEYFLLATKLLGEKFDYGLSPGAWSRLLAKLGLRVHKTSATAT